MEQDLSSDNLAGNRVFFIILVELDLLITFQPSGGSKGGRRGRAPPPGPNSFNFMQFLGKFDKFVCWRPPWGVGAPSSGKSWIRYCNRFNYYTTESSVLMVGFMHHWFCPIYLFRRKCLNFSSVLRYILVLFTTRLLLASYSFRSICVYHNKSC